MRALHLLFILPILVVHGVTGEQNTGKSSSSYTQLTNTLTTSSISISPTFTTTHSHSLHGSGQEAQHKDYLYLDIGNTSEYKPNVHHQDNPQKPVEGESNKIIVSVFSAGAEGDQVQVPNEYKAYKHGLKVFYNGAKEKIKEALNSQRTDHLSDGSDHTDPTLQLRLQVAGRDLTLEGTDGSELAPPLQYGSSDASDSDDTGTGGKNDLVVYFYQGSSSDSTTDTVPLLFKFRDKYYGPKDKASYFTTWKQVDITSGDGGSDAQSKALKEKLDDINLKLNAIDLTEIGTGRGQHEYGLEKPHGVTLTPGFQPKRIQVSQSQINGSGTSSYNIVIHKTTNGYNIGDIKQLGSCQFDNLHKGEDGIKPNEAVAVYASTDSSSLESPKLALICSSTSGSGTQSSTVHGYYDLSGGSGSSGNQYEFKKATPAFPLNQLGNRDTVQNSCAALVSILEKLVAVTPTSLPGPSQPATSQPQAEPGSGSSSLHTSSTTSLGGQHGQNSGGGHNTLGQGTVRVEQQQQESQVQEQHVEQTQQETQSKDYLYLDIGKKGSNYEAYVQHQSRDKQKVGDEGQYKTITVTDSGLDSQVPDNYKGYKHGLKDFYTGSKEQIKKVLTSQGANLVPDSGLSSDPTLYLRLQVGEQVLELVGQDGSTPLTTPPKYTQTQADSGTGTDNDLVVFFYQKGGSSGSDTVPLLFKFGGKYYGPKDRANYFLKWQEVVITNGDGGALNTALKTKLDEINRQLNDIDLTQTGTTGGTGEYGLPDPRSAVSSSGFLTRRITVSQSQSSTYTTVTHSTANGYNIGNIGGLGSNCTFDSKHNEKLPDVTANAAVAVYSGTTATASETPQLVFICTSGDGLSTSDTSTVLGYYLTNDPSNGVGTPHTFNKATQTFSMGDLTKREKVQTNCPELMTILEKLKIVPPQGPSGPQGPRGDTGEQETQVQEQHVEQQQQESQVQEQHVEQLQQTQLQDYLYLEIDKQVQYQPSVKRKTGNKHKVGDGAQTKIQVEGASGGAVDGGVDAQIPAGYKGFKIKLSDFYNQSKAQITAALKISLPEEHATDSDEGPETQLVLQVGGQELALVDSNGSPVTSLLQYGKTQASDTEKDPVVYFYGTGSTSGTPDTVPLLFKFGSRYFGPKDRDSYLLRWQELTIADGASGDALKQNIKRELDRINGLLSEIDLTKTGVRGSSEGYGLETGSVASLESFNTKRIHVTRSKIPGSNTSSAYTIVTHKTVNNYNVGSIKALNSCQFDNLHSTALTDQSHNEAVAVYRDGAEDSTPLQNPQLVLICSTGGSGTGGTSNVHGYYNLSSGSDRTGNQYLFKKATPSFPLNQLSNRETLQSSYPDLVKVMETIARVTQPLPAGGGGGGGSGHDATGLAPGSPRKPGTSSVGGSENERVIADPQAIPASTTSAPSAVSSSAPAVSQSSSSVTVVSGTSSLGRSDGNSVTIHLQSGSGLLSRQPTIQASVLRQDSTPATTQGGLSQPVSAPAVVTQSIPGSNVSGGTSSGRGPASATLTQNQASDTRQQLGTAVGAGGGGRPGSGGVQVPGVGAQQLPDASGRSNQVGGQVRTEQGTSVQRTVQQGPPSVQVHTVVNNQRVQTTTTPAAGTTTPGPISTSVVAPPVTTIQPPRVTTGIRDVTTTTNSLRGPIFSVTDRTANISRVRETTDNENLIATNIKRALTMSNFYGFENLPVAQENDAQSLKEYLFRAVRQLAIILENVKYNIAGDQEVIVRELNSNQAAYHQADLNLLNGIKFENKEEYYGLYNGFKNLYNAIVVRLNMMKLQSDPMQVLKYVGSLSLIPHSVAVQLERQYGSHVLARVGPNDRAGRVASYPLLGFRIGIVATEEIMDRIQDVLARYLRLTGSRQPSDIVTLARTQLDGLQPIRNLEQRPLDPKVPDTPDEEVRELSGYLHSIANARNAGAEQPADSTTMDEVQSLMVQSVFSELTRQLVGDKVANYLEMLGESVLDEPESQASANQLTRVLASTPAAPEQPGSSEKPGLLGSIIEKTRRVASKVREKAQGLLKSGFGTESVAVPLAIALLMYTL